MPNTYLLCKELQDAEVVKLKSFIGLYQGLVELLNELEASAKAKAALAKHIEDLEEPGKLEDVSPKKKAKLEKKLQASKDYTDDIKALKRLLKPFQEVYLTVGDSVEQYLLDTHVEFKEDDSEAELAKKLIIFISTDSFFAIRKSAAMGCSYYSTLNELYHNLIVDFPNLMSFGRFQTKLYSCVQIFSQGAMLGAALVKDRGQSEANDCFEMANTVFKILADYSNTLKLGQDYSNKTIEHASIALIPGFDAKRIKDQERLAVLKGELKSEGIDFDVLKAQHDIAQEMMETQDRIKQNELLAAWKASNPMSTMGDEFPTESGSMAKLAQEIDAVVTVFQENKAVKEIKRLIDSIESIKVALTKLNPEIADALAKVNDTQLAVKAMLDNKYHLSAIPITLHEDKIITGDVSFLTKEDKPTEEIQGPKSPKSTSFMSLLRGRSSSKAPELVRTLTLPAAAPLSPRAESLSSSSSSSSSSEEDLNRLSANVAEVDAPLSPRLKFFPPVENRVRAASAPSKPQMINQGSPKDACSASPRKGSKGNIDMPDSPSVRERIASINANGGLKFDPRPN